MKKIVVPQFLKPKLYLLLLLNRQRRRNFHEPDIIFELFHFYIFRRKPNYAKALLNFVKKLVAFRQYRGEAIRLCDLDYHFCKKFDQFSARMLTPL